MSNYYVSGCVANGDDVSMCDDSVAQFWTLYRRNEEGFSEGIIDCMFREDAETAMRAYKERDELAAENVALKSAIVSAKDDLQEHYDTDGVDSQDSEGNFMDACVRLCDAQSTIEKMESITTPATGAYLNSVRAEGVDMVRELWQSERHLVKEGDLAQFDFALSHLQLMATKLRAGEPS
ncbi:hypothetical protein [Pantoea sp. PGP6]